MYKYHNLNPISKVGLDEFTKETGIEVEVSEVGGDG